LSIGETISGGGIRIQEHNSYIKKSNMKKDPLRRAAHPREKGNKADKKINKSTKTRRGRGSNIGGGDIWGGNDYSLRRSSVGAGSSIKKGGRKGEE